MKPILKLITIVLLSASSIYAQESLVQIRAISPTSSDSTEDMVFGSGESLQKLHVVLSPIITDSHIESAKVDANEPTVVKITLSKDGEDTFNKGIKDMKGQRIAIVVKGTVVSAPVLQATEFGRELQITGNLSEADAQELAEKLNNK